MEQSKSNMHVAGVDVGKHRLDAAIDRDDALVAVDNDASGFETLIAWLKARSVGRVGLEATGGYERGVRAALEAAGFEVVIHQPIEVRLFARLTRRKAKNDRLDARLIAAATARVDTVRAAQDPRLARLSEWLTTYEMICDQAAALKTFIEHLTIDAIITTIRAQLAAMIALKTRLMREVLAMIRRHPDLAARFALLTSLPGIGPVVAATFVVRMPELGSMRKGEAASLIGVAPFDRDSGDSHGKRFIKGGRERPRRMLYIAALAAKRFDPHFAAFAQTLRDKGKPVKVAIVAVMRKLIEAANLVLKRDLPWAKQAPA